MTPEEKLAELGFTLPPVAAPIANFITHVEEGSLLYLSGQGPRNHEGQLAIGKVGAGVSVEEAYAHAQLTGLNLLAVMKHALGDLGRVERVVKLLGMVNADPLFSDHPKVINGCSDLMVDVFGDKGRHARSAVGFGSLPGQITVEIEAIIRFRKD
ncbi:RidA family protein [Aurantimonas marina]|uniref:RidA family protein n=1 Tax=Aurantimonas marina TaxID=2780508 RepID=UPI0019D17C97|nr:RidA family protein [Aurantimonas marina]